MEVLCSELELGNMLGNTVDNRKVSLRTEGRCVSALVCVGMCVCVFDVVLFDVGFCSSLLCSNVL